MTASSGTALRMVGITKRFGDLVANNAISLDVERGEILGLLGENGAGKSTLMNVLYGLLSADDGHIEVDGERVDLRSPADALGHGIGMVHQHFMLIDAFSVTENLVLGAEPARHGILDRPRARSAVGELSTRFGLGVDPDARVGRLGVAPRQRVEVLRALYRGARVLILDEPTAVLTPQESDALFTVLTGMAQQGMSIILISHKLHELMSVTRRITVLRDGQVVATVSTAETNENALASLMVGRDTNLELLVTPRERTGRPLLSARDLRDRQGRLSDINLDVHGGEIVGVAGVDGSGQSELAELLAGLAAVGAGSIALDGADITRTSTQGRLAAGLGYVPDDRSNEGLVLGLAVYENAVLRRARRRSFRRGGLLSPARMRAHARRIVTDNDIRPPSVENLAQALSGGNQQKLLMGREMADEPKVLIVSQPTRGVDIAASRAIHRRLLAARGEGRAVLLNSLDLDEIKMLSDRIVVMFEGRIVGQLTREDCTDEALGLLMAGGRRGPAGEVESRAS